MTAPESLPSPRGAHLEMVGAVLAGEGLERIGEIAARHAGAPVAVVVPRLGTDVEAWVPYERYVASKLAGGRPARAGEVVAEVPIVSGGQELGAVLMLAPGRPDAGEYLHVAAVAALTEVAVAEARDETEQTLRGSFLEELRTREDLEPHDIVRRAKRLGCDLSEGAVALCADPPAGRAAGRLIAVIGGERPDALAQIVGERVYALIPGTVEEARSVATRLGRQATVGISSRYSDPAELRRALEEAELVLDVTAGGEAPAQEIGGGTYRLLFRVLASHPEEVKSFYEDTVAAVVRYDEQYTSDLVATLEAYLAQNCNMNATATAIYAHRHTVSYRLERIRDLTGLDPFTSEDRERLGLGLKAYRIIAPRLPR